MSAETEFYSAVTGAAGVTALVSQRIYPDAAPPEDPRPFVAYRRGNTNVETFLDGTTASQTVTLDVSCWAEERDDAEDVADAVITAAVANDFSLAGRGGAFDDETGLFAATVIITWQE